jgi:hypothetical protein
VTPRGPLGRRQAPTGRRATIIGVVLSILIPGLGHAYLGYLTRALIWFGGTVVLAIVVGGGDENAGLALGMGIAIGVFAAIDTLVIRRTG